MERIPQEQIELLRESLVGKMIGVHFTFLNGKRTYTRGICQYFGYNDFYPSFKLQVTIDRTPITHLELSDIELLD